MTLLNIRENQDQNPFKCKKTKNISSLRIVSMTPGDREVAGCLSFLFHNFGGYVNG